MQPHPQKMSVDGNVRIAADAPRCNVSECFAHFHPAPKPDA